MVNLELYRIFVMVASKLNITRASEELNLTQSAVTKQIKSLEEQLNAKLFIRTNHGMILTQQGKNLYSKIKDETNLLINVENDFKLVRDIKLGVHSTILNRVLGKSISDFYKKNVDSKILTFNHENEEMLKELEERKLDIVFSKKIETKYSFKNIKFVKFGEWHDVLIVNSNNDLLKKEVFIDDLKDKVICMPKKSSETPKNFFKSINCNYDFFKNIRHITYSTIAEIIKDSNDVGLITREFLIDEIEKYDLKELNTNFKIRTIEFGIYINTDKYFELNEFINILKLNFKNN